MGFVHLLVTPKKIIDRTHVSYTDRHKVTYWFDLCMSVRPSVNKLSKYNINSYQRAILSECSILTEIHEILNIFSIWSLDTKLYEILYIDSIWTIDDPHLKLRKSFQISFFYPVSSKLHTRNNLLELSWKAVQIYI